MHDPIFSVVIPTHNRPERLLACLAGLAAQAEPFPPFEVLVVNDGERLPSDAELGRLDSRLSVRILSAPGQGPALARNVGAAGARGRYLAFVDDDCVPGPGWLRALAAGFAKNPDAMLGGKTVNALMDNPCADASQLLVEFLSTYYDGSAPERTRFFATSNLAVPAEAFRDIGGFDPQFSHAAGEDRDFCDRWHASGRRSARADDAVVYHHHRLDLQGYFAQHFRYGRGAQRFHRAQRGRVGKVPGAPADFYLNLILYPLTNRTVLRGAARSTLLLAAQAATAAGYLWEAASSEAEPKR